VIILDIEETKGSSHPAEQAIVTAPPGDWAKACVLNDD